ncbi:MAG TPA: nuclear transport factor 2 family protein [Bacteroidota bacterium]|nr:nuclear transport factor 2 family protein [Bacteroidota bacterium]
MFRMLLIAGTLTAAMSAPAWTQEHGETASGILAFEDARFAAMLSADTSTLARMLADDLAYVHSTGRVETKAEFLTAIGSGALRYLTFSPDERRVILLDSSSAVIVGRIRGTVTVNGRNVVLDARYTAVYHREKQQGWKLRAWQSTRITP